MLAPTCRIPETGRKGIGGARQLYKPTRTIRWRCSPRARARPRLALHCAASRDAEQSARSLAWSRRRSCRPSLTASSSGPASPSRSWPLPSPARSRACCTSTPTPSTAPATQPSTCATSTNGCRAAARATPPIRLPPRTGMERKGHHLTLAAPAATGPWRRRCSARTRCR